MSSRTFKVLRSRCQGYGILGWRQDQRICLFPAIELDRSVDIYDGAAVSFQSTQFSLDSDCLAKPNITTRMASEGQKGKRLLANVIDFYSSNDPTRVWATAPVDDEDLSKGYKDITYEEYANAINHASWWLKEKSSATAPAVRIPRFSYGLLRSGICYVFNPRNHVPISFLHSLSYRDRPGFPEEDVIAVIAACDGCWGPKTNFAIGIVRDIGLFGA